MLWWVDPYKFINPYIFKISILLKPKDGAQFNSIGENTTMDGGNTFRIYVQR